MSRVFWIAVGAVGGIAVYRKSTEAVAHARELGPLGTAQAVAGATSQWAGGTARGLGRLQVIRDRRSGRLVVGTVESTPPAPAVVGGTADRSVPADWVPSGTTTPSVIVTEDPPVARPSADQGAARPSTAGIAATSTARTNPRRRARHD